MGRQQLENHKRLCFPSSSINVELSASMHRLMSKITLLRVEKYAFEPFQKELNPELPSLG